MSKAMSISRYKTMIGIFVNSDGPVKYAREIVNKRKPIETRSRNTLKRLIGQTVQIIETGKGKRPMIIGQAKISKAVFVAAADFDKYRELTLIPAGGPFDCKGKGKWFYYLENAKPCKPYAMPENAIRHGYTWVEF